MIARSHNRAAPVAQDAVPRNRQIQALQARQGREQPGQASGRAC